MSRRSRAVPNVAERPSSRARGPTMAEQTTEPYQPESETWASGIAQFGAVIMILVGAYQALTGVVALVRGEFFVASPNYVFQLNTTTWGGPTSSLESPGSS